MSSRWILELRHIKSLFFFGNFIISFPFTRNNENVYEKAHPTPPKKQTHTLHSQQRWALEHEFFVQFITLFHYISCCLCFVHPLPCMIWPKLVANEHEQQQVSLNIHFIQCSVINSNWELTALCWLITTVWDIDLNLCCTVQLLFFPYLSCIFSFVRQRASV